MPNANGAKHPGAHPPGLDTRTVFDLAWAAFELALARLRLKSRSTKRLIASAALSESFVELEVGQDEIAKRVAFAIPHAAARMPWRTDCIIQAIAAERWLRRHGISSDLFFGMPKKPRKKFEAHAWLKAGGRVITGGDITKYVPFRR